MVLQRLEQRHEIPHGKNMVFQKSVQIVNSLDFLVQRVLQQSFFWIWMLWLMASIIIAVFW
jgi:hypothetical protein